MRKLLNAFYFITEEFIPTLTLIITVLALIIQVFFRYILNISLEWTFELSIYAFIWTLFLGAAYARREGRHVNLDIIYNRLSESTQRFFNLFFNIITTFIFIVIVKPVGDYLIFLYRIKTVSLKIPWTYVYGVFLLFLILMILHNLEYIYEDIMYFYKKRK